MEVTGGDGLSNDGNDYVSDGGYAIDTKGTSRISEYGTLIATGGAGGDNKETGYNFGDGGLGSLAINLNKITIDSSVNATLIKGSDGSKAF